MPPIVLAAELPVPPADAPTPVAFGLALALALSGDLAESVASFWGFLGGVFLDGATGAVVPGDAPMGLNSFGESWAFDGTAVASEKVRAAQNIKKRANGESLLFRVFIFLISLNIWQHQKGVTFLYKNLSNVCNKKDCMSASANFQIISIIVAYHSRLSMAACDGNRYLCE